MTNKKKAFKLIEGVLSTLLTVALIITLISVFSAQMRGEVPSILGFCILKVVSGSMEDTIPTGVYILVRHVRPEDVRRDDIICFYSEDPKIYGYPNTHRVVEDPIKTENGYEYVTMGDANLKPDDYNATSDKLIGRYVKSLPRLTAVASFFTGNYSLLFIMGIQLAFAVMVVYSLIKRRAFGKSEDGGEADSTGSQNNNS